jgi:hypothetical protein
LVEEVVLRPSRNQLVPTGGFETGLQEALLNHRSEGALTAGGVASTAMVSTSSTDKTGVSTSSTGGAGSPAAGAVKVKRRSAA